MKILEFCSTCNMFFEIDVVSKEDVPSNIDCPICKRPIFPNNIKENEKESAKE